MSTPFTMDDEEYFFDAESELDLSEQKNKAVLLMKVTNAYLPALGGILRGTVIKGEYSLMPNNAQARFQIDLGLTCQLLHTIPLGGFLIVQERHQLI